MNTKKSQVIVFSKCPSHKKEALVLKIFNQIIPQSNEVTYLGVIFDQRLSWEQQIRKICERAYSRLNLLRAMTSMTKKHNATLIGQLYNSTIRSLFEYSCVCIVSAADVHLKKLQLIQNEALRIILKVPSYIPIATMNDSGNQVNVKEHLSLIAGERIKRLRLSSYLVRRTVEAYRKLKISNFNASPLDVVKF